MAVKTMPCPWFKSGMCTSPKLDEPTDAVVSIRRCGGDEKEYKLCQFYVDPASQNRKQASKTEASKTDKEMVLPIIHVTYEKPVSGCRFFVVEKYQNHGYIARCQVLGRLLTISEIDVCSKYWELCPLRRRYGG